MSKKGDGEKGEKGGGEKWWLTLLVAVLPSLVAGWFSLRAIDKANQSSAQADTTSKEVQASYDLMKQALELVQHEADADRDALQKNNELLVQLLQQKSHRTEEEGRMLAAARDLSGKLNQPPTVGARPQLPVNLHEYWLQRASDPKRQ
jgi:hypothetical protein